MSREAMKLALEALENSVDLVREDAYQAEKLYGNYPTRQGKVAGLKVLADDHEKAISALREALAEQPAQKCSYPYCGCNSKAWCKVERNEALDKMAENARELGLDYEPATYTFKQSSEPVFAAFDMKPNHNMTFHNQDGKHVGALDFNGPEMVFNGDMNESAKVFFDFIASAFKARLEQERADERKSMAHSLGPGEMDLSLRRNHKDELFECRRRFSAEEVMHGPDFMVEATASNLEVEMDRALREWNNT